MPQFEPFRGVRYDLSRVAIADVAAPPYDVISPAERAALVARHPDNIVRVDLPDEADGSGRYEAANRVFRSWLEDGVLERDESSMLSVYRMAYEDDLGQPVQTLGVVGALQLSRPGEGDILPHEETTPKAKSDRLDLLRATRTNLSAVWMLSLTEGLTELCATSDTPWADWVDDDGVRHTLWRITEPARLDAISAAVAASPVVVADGHHRYETSLTYRDEQRAVADHDAGGAEWVMCYVVELVDDQLTVRPIHRLLSGFPQGFDVEAALAGFFEPLDTIGVDAKTLVAMDEVGALVLVRPDGSARLLRPRPECFAGVADLDSSRLTAALQTLPPHEVVYQHGVDNVLQAVRSGDADLGVLLRPATVAQIRANAHTGERMPPKTTFFHPKPKTGLVFRMLDER